tara:strand:- start:976 stop:2364 length:1389 start_codon:yes stop_codon:yes gene_type:complete
MNEYILSTAIIIVILAIGLIVLIQFGVSFAAYFGVTIILITILGSVLYTWWKTKKDKTVESLKHELLLKIKHDILETNENIINSEELINQKQVLIDLDSIKNSFIIQKLFDENFDTTENFKKFTLTHMEQENRKTEQLLRGLENIAAVNYNPKLEMYIQELNSKLDDIVSAGYNIKLERESYLEIARKETTTLREMLRKRKVVRVEFSAILKKCLIEVKALLTLSQKYGQILNVGKKITKSQDNLTDFTTSVELLIDSRVDLRNFLSDFFKVEYKEISSSINSLSPFLKDAHITSDEKIEIEEIIENILETKEAGLLNSLQDQKVIFKNRVSSITEHLNRDLQILSKEIQKYTPHEDIWKADEMEDPIIKRMRVDSELRVFTRHAADALKYLTDTLHNDNILLKILKNYGNVEPLITMKLEQQNELSAADLNVKYPEKFLIIYSKKHSNTIYRKTTSTLVNI